MCVRTQIRADLTSFFCRFRVCDWLDREERQEAQVQAGEDQAEGEEHGPRAVRRPLQSSGEHAQRGGGHPEEHLHTAGIGLGAAHEPPGTCTCTTGSPTFFTLRAT